MSNLVLITRGKSILFYFLSKNRHNFSNKAVLKMKIPKNIYNKKCGLKLLFSTEIVLKKMLIIFDIEIIFESPILALFDKA